MSDRHAIPLLVFVFGPSLAAAQATSPAAPGPGATPPEPLSLGAAFDEDLLRDLPGSRRAWSWLETTDATAIVDRIDNGGLFTGEAERLGVHGASWTQSSYRLGALDVTDPDATGTPLFLLDPGAFARVELSSGLMPANEGGPGPSLTFVPRIAGASWNGTIAGALFPVGLQGQTPSGPPPIARYEGLAGGRFRVGGPLRKDRLGLSLAGSLMKVRRIERASPTPVEGVEAGLLAHLSWKAGERDEVRFVGAFQKTRRPYSGRARFVGDPEQTDRFSNAQVTWERRATAPVTLSAGYARGRFRPDLDSSQPGVTVDRLQAGPIPLLFPGNGTRERALLSAAMEPFRVRAGGGEHALRVGLAAFWSRSVTRPGGSPSLTAESVNGAPARVWEYAWAGPESRWSALEWAAYAADRVSRGPAVLDAGLRVERTHGWAATGPGEIRWTGASPRLAARVDLMRGGALALRGGYAQYLNRLPLGLLAYGDLSAAQGRVYRWLDPNGDGRFETGEEGPLVARVGPGGAYASIASDLRAPKTEEVVIGLEARLGRAWTASVLGIHRRARDLVASTNVGAPARIAYTVRFVPDPGGDILGPEDDQLLPVFARRPASFGQDRYLLANTGENVLHEGIEVALRRRAGDRLRLLVGATASRSLGPGGSRGFAVYEDDEGVIGERLEDPNAATFSRGRLFFDRAYTLKLAATWHGPKELRLGAVARYQDGQPFARLVIARDLPQGPEAVQAIPNGRSRFAYTLTLDARAEKGVRVGRARLAMVVEAFNLLGTANEAEEDVTTGPTFRAVTAVQSPRAVVLELRADF